MDRGAELLRGPHRGTKGAKGERGRARLPPSPSFLGENQGSAGASPYRGHVEFCYVNCLHVSAAMSAKYCYWSVATGEYGALMEECVRTARAAGVFKEFHVLTDRPLAGCASSSGRKVWCPRCIFRGARFGSCIMTRLSRCPTWRWGSGIGRKEAGLPWAWTRLWVTRCTSCARTRRPTSLGSILTCGPVTRAGSFGTRCRRGRPGRGGIPSETPRSQSGRPWCICRVPRLCSPAFQRARKQAASPAQALEAREAAERASRSAAAGRQPTLPRRIKSAAGGERSSPDNQPALVFSSTTT